MAASLPPIEERRLALQDGARVRVVVPHQVRRFWSCVRPEAECLVWGRPRARDDYGRFALRNDERMLAHRLAYLLVVGPIPAGRLVLHSCRNRACVRTEHLYLGGRPEVGRALRARFAEARGGPPGRRPPRPRPPSPDRLRGHLPGADNVNAVLDEARVRELFARFTPGNGRALAAEYGISHSGLRHIVEGRNWKHLRLLEGAGRHEEGGGGTA